MPQNLEIKRHRQPRPGLLGVRGVGYVSPSVRSFIDYEEDQVEPSLKRQLSPPDGHPTPWTAGVTMDSSRKANLAKMVLAQRPVQTTELDLSGMLKQAFGPFVTFKLKKEGGRYLYRLGSGDKKVEGVLTSTHGTQVYISDGEIVAKSRLKVGASVTDRLADMADDYLSFTGDAKSFKRMLRSLNSKKE
jgi:hypothetical protein